LQSRPRRASKETRTFRGAPKRRSARDPGMTLARSDVEFSRNSKLNSARTNTEMQSSARVTNEDRHDVGTNANLPAEPSAVSAAERAIEAAQRIVVERIELLRLEVIESISSLAQRVGLMMAAGVVALLGWVGFAIAAVIVLSHRMPLAGSIALVAGIHVLAGIALATYASAAGVRRKTS
jgi:hypothetical protein